MRKKFVFQDKNRYNSLSNSNFIFLAPLYRPWSKASQAVSTLNYDDIREFLGIDEEVGDSCLDDPFCKNYFEFESGLSEPLVKGRLKSAYNYWRDVLLAPPEVLDIIQNGYRIEFVEPPPKIHCNNNLSAIRNAEFVESAIEELLKFNLIEEREAPPSVVSPLSVADNGTKKRLILDLSKLNDYILLERIVLEDGRDFFNLAQNFKYMSSFDLKSAYHQAKIIVCLYLFVCLCFVYFENSPNQKTHETSHSKK